ncbi:AMP-binding protein [Marinobacterium stanieri]|uniref:AMP-binding protein n=1 Tax=Marinobacterium stanieri TaxID=49186 RepID=UPI003A8CC8FA
MKGLIPLCDWLNQAPAHPVAISHDGPVGHVAFTQQVARCYWQLPSAKPGQHWAVYHADTLVFLAWVLALWQRGCTVCVPGDNRPGTNQRLSNRVSGFVGDYPVELSSVDQTASETVSIPEWRALDTGFPALEIYTSGSTGEPKPVQKTFAQLQSELEALEALWPDHHDAVVVTTVTHQHLYGLTFRLFWPLCRGQLFESSQCQFSEEIFQRAHQYAHFSLVSTPSHLSRFNPVLDWDEVESRCVAVVSSAAPLMREDSLAVAALLHAPVREIYGSSETGALAWRIQAAREESPWQLLPGVQSELTADATLKVSAPQVTGGCQTLSDRVVMAADGRFRLLGRTDRIAKIEGKRVSLVEIEQQAEQQPLIKLARSLVLNGRRTEVGLVAELTDEGNKILQSHGKRALVQQLKAALSRCFEPVVLPRRWRFVSHMPYNAQGKITVESLKTLFQADSTKWPSILSQTAEAASAELMLHVPASLIYFDGHFAGNPILPGITQVHWAAHYGRELLGVEGVFCRLEAAKFQQVIFPESQVRLELEYQAEKNKLVFRYVSDKGGHSSGRICFS